ncbi:hypothetical protein B566_EDAN005028 [Ephemera danica]|nr:hypothetical protein B566_EDAN005028 [Ephemera danica]
MLLLLLKPVGGCLGFVRVLISPSCHGRGLIARQQQHPAARKLAGQLVQTTVPRGHHCCTRVLFSGHPTAVLLLSAGCPAGHPARGRGVGRSRRRIAGTRPRGPRRAALHRAARRARVGHFAGSAEPSPPPRQQKTLPASSASTCGGRNPAAAVHCTRHHSGADPRAPATCVAATRCSQERWRVEKRTETERGDSAHRSDARRRQRVRSLVAHLWPRQRSHQHSASFKLKTMRDRCSRSVYSQVMMI